MSLNVRPYKAFQASAWLTSNSTIDREQGVLFNENCQNNFQENIKITDNKKEQNENTAHTQTRKDNLECQNDEWSKGEVHIRAGVTDTMLIDADFLNDYK